MTMTTKIATTSATSFNQVLIIDDLGTEKASEWVSETMFKNHRQAIPRSASQLSSLSNLELGELSERLDRDIKPNC